MLRFSPQVIPFMLMVAAMFFAAQGAFVSAIHLWYGNTYRQVAFVMDEWRDNDGSPYVAGSIAGSSEPSPFHLPGKVVDGARVLGEAPTVPFEAGRTVNVWYSPDAPLMTYNGEGVNAVPVDGLPVRPGWGRLLASLATTFAVAVVGLFATVWVAKRWAMRITVT
ncbi:MAG: hypothetical protein HS109_05520 [Burkholderiales bacterium]|nr:hypothetical protein [Burkholderiales bacterium]MCE7877019.1 hypothetical protein [Betaproteobacteria bacterium PRO3]